MGRIDATVPGVTTALLINGALGLLPVLAFLAMLTQSDTFKLVRRNYVAALILAGAAAAIVAYGAGKTLMAGAGVGYDDFVRLAGPLLEEALKALIVLFLIRTNRIGFVLDAAIAGFAIGAGFALVENYFYLQVIGHENAAVWVVRGFGAAIMHGGATSIFAIIAQSLTPQQKKAGPARVLPGFAAAALLHVLFNQFLDYPVASTLVMMIGLSTSLSVILHRDRQSIDRLLNVNFDDYRRLLAQIRSGEFERHEFGRALQSLRVRFDPAEVAEIVHYAELHTELVLFGQEILKAQGEGRAIEAPDAIRDKLAHFHYLEERIGAAVRLALRRHFQFSRQDFFQLYKLQRDAGQIAAKAHAFNTDLLLNERDQKVAREDYPGISFALEDPALQQAFASFDRRANRSKIRSRRFGALAVALATLALLIASAVPLFIELSAAQARFLAGAGGAMLAASVLVGAFGLIQRGRKKRWLADRLATERIRQFHFQHYIANANAILAGAKRPDAAAAYRAQRTEAFARFSRDFFDHIDEALHVIVHEEDCGDGVLFHGAEEAVADDPHLDQYFTAYGRLRFDMQINYCNHVLRESRGLRRRSAKRQAKTFQMAGLFGLAAVLTLYAAALAGAFAGSGALALDLLAVLGASAAILTLASRTIEEGLQPKREIERMRQYRIQLRRANARFREAETAAAKIAAMRDLERLTYEEMVLFLKSSYESQFVM